MTRDLSWQPSDSFFSITLKLPGIPLWTSRLTLSNLLNYHILPSFSQYGQTTLHRRTSTKSVQLIEPLASRQIYTDIDPSAAGHEALDHLDCTWPLAIYLYRRSKWKGGPAAAGILEDDKIKHSVGLSAGSNPIKLCYASCRNDLRSSFHLGIGSGSRGT